MTEPSSVARPLRSRLEHGATAAVFTTIAMLALAIPYLRWQGRVWWCRQGDLTIVSFVVNSPHNSQHVFDAYSLSHVSEK